MNLHRRGANFQIFRDRQSSKDVEWACSFKHAEIFLTIWDIDLRHFILAILVALPITANAQNIMNGNEMQQSCKEYNELELYCIGYIEGLVTTMFFHKASGNYSFTFGGRETREFCMPTGVTAGQRRDIILKWLRDHPEERNLNSAWLVFKALYEAFPCSQ